MSVDAFIPEVWSARLLANLRKSLVFRGLCNTDYEGDIAQAGDTVRVQSIGAVSIGTYSKNTNINAAEALTDAEATLAIDQAKYFNFQVDDVDARQVRPDLVDGAMAEASYGLADAVDQYIAGLYGSAGSTVGTSGSPKTDLGTATNAYIHLVSLAIELDKQNVPRGNRWVVIPPWYYGKLLLDDRFVKSGTAGGDQRLMTGEVGAAAGFSVFLSNNVSNNATTWRIPAGTSQAITFAEQINKTVAYTPELRFADAVKGLLLYGAKVFRPEALSVLYANA